MLNEEQINYYKENLDKFIDDYLTKIRLSPFQREVLQKVSKYRSRLSIHGGRGVGKSYVMAYLIITLLAIHDEITITILAGKIKTTKDSVWRAVKEVYNDLPIEFKSIINVPLEEKITRKPKKGDAITASADIVGYQEGGEATIQGRHSENLVLIVDEASIVSNRAMETLYFSMTQGNNKMVLLGNPHKASGYFFDTHYHRTKSKLWDKRVISSYEAAGVEKIINDDGTWYYKDIWEGKDYVRTVSLDFLKENEERYSENSDDRRVYILGLPPKKSVNALFLPEQIKSFEFKIDKKSDDGFGYVVGIIIGDSLYPTVISYRIGSILVKQDVLLEANMKKVIEWIDNKLSRVNVNYAVISFSNLNVYIKEKLLELRYSILFADEVEVDDGVKNHRSMAYQHMQKWVMDYEEQISINDLDVIDNLCCIEGKYDGIGRVSVETQEAFRIKYETSCNYSDSLANTFLIPDSYDNLNEYDKMLKKNKSFSTYQRRKY